MGDGRTIDEGAVGLRAGVIDYVGYAYGVKAAYDTIIDVRGKTVKLGIQSPETTTIYRQEVMDKIRETNAAARVDADVVKRVLGGQ